MACSLLAESHRVLRPGLLTHYASRLAGRTLPSTPAALLLYLPSIYCLYNFTSQLITAGINPTVILFGDIC